MSETPTVSSITVLGPHVRNPHKELRVRFTNGVHASQSIPDHTSPHQFAYILRCMAQEIETAPELRA